MARTLPTGTAKLALATSHALIWISSAIVVGITGYFLDNYAHDKHLIFEIVIAALALAFWLPSAFAPFLKTYRQYYLPLNSIFSYLWLTAFIFAAQDYNESSCWANAPPFGHCTLKLTNEAFIFLAFFFTLVALLIEIFVWRTTRVPTNTVVEKDVRPSVEPAV